MPIFRRDRFPDFDFTVGTGAEYILITADTVVFSCAGVLQRVGLVGPSDKSEGLWKIESHVEGETTLLYQGDYHAVSRRFSLVTERAKGKCSSHKLALTALFAALLGAASVFAIQRTIEVNRYGEIQSQPAEIDFAELVDALKSTGMDYSQMLPALAERSGLTPEELNQLKRPNAEPTPSQDMPPVADTGKSQADGESVLPKYDPSMYADNDVLEAPSTSEKNASEKAGSSQEEPTAPSDELNDELNDEVEAQLKALPPEEAAAALRQLSMLKPEQMQGAALDGLPDSVKAIIQQAHAERKPTQPAPGIQTTDEAGVPTKLIILPPAVIDQFRSYDGIASIPENSSWQARGNPTVRLPLPGGGDIQSVTDLEKFGFKP